MEFGSSARVLELLPRGGLARLLGCLALATMALGGTSVAKDFKIEGGFGWVAKGNLTAIGSDHYFWVGSYDGINVLSDPTSPLQGSAVVCPAYQDVGVGSGGYCQVFADKDNIAFTKWQSDGGVPSGRGTITFIGGTGKFAGASGGGEFSYVFAGAANPDGTQSGFSTYHNAVLTLPD